MIKFIPSKNYKGLLKQANALHTIIQSREEERRILLKRDHDLSAKKLLLLEENLESERSMNEKLTNELEAIDPKRMNARLRSDIEEIMSASFAPQIQMFRRMCDPDNKYMLMKDVITHIHDKNLKWAHSQAQSTVLNNVKRL